MPPAKQESIAESQEARGWRREVGRKLKSFTIAPIHIIFLENLFTFKKVSFGAVTTGCFRHLEIPLFPLFKCVLPFPQVPTVPLDAEDEVDNVEDIVEVLGQITWTIIYRE